MTDSILVSTAKAIAAAIVTERDASGFDITDFDCEIEFDGRAKQIEPEEGRVVVQVVVPRKWDEVDRISRGANGLEYVGTFDIDVKKKLGFAAQEANDRKLEIDELSALTRLVEQLHLFFWGTLSQSRVMVTDHSLAAEWIPSRDGVPGKSQVLVAYSETFLADYRLFYGCCREVFQLTAGT